MLDFTAFAAQEFAEAVKNERAYEVERHKWYLRLRELKLADRAKAKRSSRTTPPRRPGPLSGAHSPWI